MMERHERGEGRVGTFIFLALVVAIGWAAWKIVPIYVDHYDFKDKVNEICRTPKYRAGSNDAILDMLMKEVRERRLGEWIDKQSFEINTVETSRRIRLYYEREAEILPGWKKKFVFDFTVDQPLV
jgi:hypothetical protein